MYVCMYLCVRVCMCLCMYGSIYLYKMIHKLRITKYPEFYVISLHCYFYSC